MPPPPTKTTKATMRAARDGGERPVKQRRYAPKVRSGCVTCKIRRVKCDETKPFCDRCTGTGRKCDGYTTSADTFPMAASQEPGREPLTMALVAKTTDDVLEKRTFEFFRAKTTRSMAGYFPDSVWDRTVLQVCQSEPTVRYAVNALGALHEERFLRRNAEHNGVAARLVQTTFPVKQYAKALNGLQQLLNSSDVSMTVILISSLLCIHFEGLRENFVPTLVHAENAIRLLHASAKANSHKVDASLIQAFLRIDLQASLYIGVRVPGLPDATPAAEAELPSALQSLTHARDLLETWTSRLFYFLRAHADRHKYHDPGDIPLEFYAEAASLESRFNDLDHLLWLYMQSPTARLTFREHHGLSLLRARTKVNAITAATALYAETAAFDSHLPAFETILAICTHVMASEDPASDTHPISAVTLDEGLLHNLTFTATNCRDSRLRRSALALMRTLVVRDNTWLGEVMVRGTELAVEIEERGCDNPNPRCEDIPEWRRVHLAGVDAQQYSAVERRKGVRMNFRVRPNGLDGEWFDFVLPVEMDARCVPDLRILRDNWFVDPPPGLLMPRVRVVEESPAPEPQGFTLPASSP